MLFNTLSLNKTQSCGTTLKKKKKEKKRDAKKKKERTGESCVHSMYVSIQNMKTDKTTALT
jgi:hypothetical protein